MKFSQNYRQLSAIYFYCFTRFVEQFLADFLLLFLPLPSPLAQKALFTAKISFSTTSHRSARAKRQNHAAFAFARYAHMLPGGATRLQGLLRFLELAHSCVDTERLFSLERAFRAICAYCLRLYDDHVLPRSQQRALCARATLRTFRRTHSLRSDCFCFEKMRRTFFPLKIKKRDRPSPFAKKKTPHVVFGGTAFCRCREIRHLFAYFIDSSGY